MSRSLSVAVVLLSTVVRAGPPVTELDCGANPRLLDSHFARYGFLPTRYVVRDNNGVRIWLPTATPGIGQTGLYSFFAVAGDFEFSVAYEVLDVAPPQGGYGASIGIAVDTQGPGGSVALARGQAPKQPPGYVVSRGVPADGGTKYESTFHASAAKAGRLALRRQKAEVVCLVADGPAGELRELCRLPFAPDTVRQVRIYADAGGSKTAVDGRFSHVKISATEIAGGVPVYEPPRSTAWWWAGGGCSAAAVAVLAVRRKRRGQWPWSNND